MTKENYHRIANAILEARRGLAIHTNGPDLKLFEYAVSWIIGEISSTLATDNPRFDSELFKNACLKKVP